MSEKNNPVTIGEDNTAEEQNLSQETSDTVNSEIPEADELDFEDPDELDAAAKKTKKKLPNWVIFVILAAIIGAAVIGTKFSSGAKNKKNANTGLSVVEVSTGNVKETINSNGTIDSENKIIVYSPVNAKVTVCNAKVGRAVKAGDKLIEFDTTTLEQDNQTSQLQLLANNQSNQETYDAANKAAAAQIKAANEAAQAACDAANSMADDVNAQGAATDQAWADYNDAQAALDAANNNTLNDEQKQRLQNDKDELYGKKDGNGNVIAGQEGWKNESDGTYTEKYNMLKAAMVAADDAIQAAKINGSSQTILEQKEKEYAKAKLELEQTDARIATLEAEISELSSYGSAEKAAAEVKVAEAEANAQAAQAAYDSMYSQWQSAYQSAQSSNGSVDTSDTAVQGSAQTQMEIGSNAAELAAMTAEQLVEAGRAGLTAKFNGVISDVQAAVGTDAMQGSPMYTLVDTNAMIVTLEVSTNDYGKYQVGKKATIKIGSNTYDGTVSNVNAMATTNAKGNPVVLVNIKINNADNNIVIGGSAKVTMTVAEAKNVLCVPTEVINTSSDGEFVFMIEDGKVKKVPVTIGVTSDTKVEITDGLKKGDQVVSDTTTDITEGMEATAADSSSSTK